MYIVQVPPCRVLQFRFSGSRSDTHRTRGLLDLYARERWLKLTSNPCRCIPDYEIGTAVLHICQADLIKNIASFRIS